ncbi:MAG: radical SAM protein [Oligoflexia bacterium]|nr:radical SAM protein [Oligoflexia bacterium]MBF0365052.1 radical SAM protein [Oligoflexia bacterium]
MSMLTIRQKGTLLKQFFRAKFSHTSTPLALRWNITSRCHNSCLYCNNHKLNRHPDLELKEIEKITQKILKLKIARLSISGGEPLLSPHFDYIVRFCKNHRISPIINSSGQYFAENLNTLKLLDLIQFSIDGDHELMNTVRGGKAALYLQQAIELAQKEKIKFSFCATLSKHNTNLKTIDYLLDLATHYKTVVAFQPIKRVYLKEAEFAEHAPRAIEMQKVVTHLLEKKRSPHSSAAIRNTELGLQHLLAWPHYGDLPCMAGKLFFVIQADGTCVACDRTDYNQNLHAINFIESDLESVLQKMRTPLCEGCGFCGNLELAHLFHFKYQVLHTLRKIA